jgi:ABC-type antimicrobial peptide transport system permease subunit
LKANPFAIGFLIGAVLYIALNLLSAHLMSDCGLPAVFGISGCADDVVRAGFPFPFYERGGFDFRNIFNLPVLLLDLLFGLALAVLGGYIARNRSSK